MCNSPTIELSMNKPDVSWHASDTHTVVSKLARIWPSFRQSWPTPVVCFRHRSSVAEMGPYLDPMWPKTNQGLPSLANIGQMSGKFGWAGPTLAEIRSTLVRFASNSAWTLATGRAMLATFGRHRTSSGENWTNLTGPGRIPVEVGILARIRANLVRCGALKIVPAL